MEDKEVIEGNIIISSFMDCNLTEKMQRDCHKFPTMDGTCTSRWLRYHKSWDWKMSVVEKIETIEDDKYGRFVIHIYSNACSIQSIKQHPIDLLPLYMSDPNAILDTKIESTWYNIVSFIKWYSQHKQINP